MLTKIAVIGLFNEFDYEIALKDGPLTFLHAQNGNGKSTLMKLVCNVMQGNLEDVRTVPFQRLDLYFDNNSKLIVENRNQELTVLMSKNQLEEEISPDDLPDILNAVYIDPDRAYIYNDDGSLMPSLMVYMEELSMKIGKAISDSALNLEETSDKKFTEADLDQIFKNANAKINFIRQAGFEPSIPAGFRMPPSRFEMGERMQKYTALALSLKEYVDKYYEFAESIVVYKDIVNTLYVNKSIEVNNKGYIQARMDKSGTVVPLSKLSSGEKQVLIIFYLLLFKTAPGSLVVIDEPEVSLHVSWQQQIGKFVNDVARVRNLKVIVSTHSPSVIHNDWDLAVELGTPSE